MKTYYSTEVNISYQEFKQLNKEGKCEIGISNQHARQIISFMNTYYISKGTKYAYYFWNLVGLIIFSYSIYESFISVWWYFILGFFTMLFVFRINEKSNAENIISEASNNIEVYNAIYEAELMVFKLDSSIDEKYLI
jgi:hypothetical protein